MNERKTIYKAATNQEGEAIINFCKEMGVADATLGFQDSVYCVMYAGDGPPSVGLFSCEVEVIFNYDVEVDSPFDFVAAVQRELEKGAFINGRPVEKLDNGYNFYVGDRFMKGYLWIPADLIHRIAASDKKAREMCQTEAEYRFTEFIDGSAMSAEVSE